MMHSNHHPGENSLPPPEGNTSKKAYHLASLPFCTVCGVLSRVSVALSARQLASCLFVLAWLVFPAASFAWSRQPAPVSPQCPVGNDKAEALFQEGLDYDKGRKGKEVNVYRAAELYEQSLRQGNAKAALMLARDYFRSFSRMPVQIPRVDFHLHLIRHAVGMGCPEAYIFLAEAYQNGWGVKADTQKAWELIRLSAEQGAVSAMVAWGSNLHFAHRFDRTPEGKQKREEGKMWLKKALKMGYGYAGYELARIYSVHEQDAENQIRVLREGARLGNANCLFRLANIYRLGEDGQEKDLQYAGILDAIRARIDLDELPRPVPDFDRLLPPKKVRSYQSHKKETL
jgi:TPR repeat protein